MDKVYSVKFDSLLFGHEGWIYGAHWAPPVRDGNAERIP